MESIVSTLFLSFNTGKSADHAKDKSYAILTQILLQRQSAFSALAKRVALAFVQMAELNPLDSSELFLEQHKKKQQKHGKHQQQKQHSRHRTVKISKKMLSNGASRAHRCTKTLQDNTKNQL